MICIVCGSTEGVRHFELRVDGIALRVQPDLCGHHGDAYLLHVGRVLGVLLRIAGKKRPTVTPIGNLHDLLASAGCGKEPQK